MKRLKPPMQPIVIADDRVIRFQGNKIVQFLIDWASSRGVDMNTLAIMEFPVEDREQFLQLIGYSLGGYSELSYVRDKSVLEADNAAKPCTCKTQEEKEMTQTEKKAAREHLRKKGWTDVSQENMGKKMELWQPPDDGSGHKPVPFALEAAYHMAKGRKTKHGT